jgi:hypothetical protein
MAGSLCAGGGFASKTGWHFAPDLGDIPAMTVIAGNKKRVALPAKPGGRFDVRVVADGQFVLTRLEPFKPRPAKVIVRKRGGYSVGQLDHPINEAASGTPRRNSHEAFAGRRYQTSGSGSGG